MILSFLMLSELEESSFLKGFSYYNLPEIVKIEKNYNHTPPKKQIWPHKVKKQSLKHDLTGTTRTKIQFHTRTTLSQRHKTGNIRKDQVTQRPELRNDVYKPHQGNVQVNPSNGIASQPKPSNNIVHDTRVPESGPGPPSSTKLVPGTTKSTPTLTGQASRLPPKLPQSLTEPEPKPRESRSQGIKSLPTIQKPGTKLHLESPPTLLESPPTLPESPPNYRNHTLSRSNQHPYSQNQKLKLPNHHLHSKN
uniref:Uncharacterized protein n=1 Tax=Amphimedon queenslandica TaxID=400682 RepID=A0A1X7TE44_AMPQE